ncbi:spindle assembly abnormal protein 6 homolog [Sitodiplosis mosellana]|uniref:spindle assembly abnormal protein 6 homolog n=1 Tax=Sitodiplosis mosellana TaxID=263140 RepID=UPI0024449DC7|nr:spindle assembly abnormal protein 6 homolog [Sitodiplosis mosellana]
MDYRFFIDPKMKASKYLVYKCDSLPIEMVLATDKMNANSYEDYNFCIEKHKTMNLIQIRLSSVRDNTAVFICTIDNSKFEHFKVEQSLYVTFEAFVNHITEMVEKCRQKQMNMLLTMVNNGFEPNKQQKYRLQFYEKGTLKNLEHISLPIESAPYEVILFHINQTCAYSQEENRILMQKNNNLQLELAQKDEQIGLLNGVINGQKHNWIEQERVLKERCKEQLTRLEIEIKELNDGKNYQSQEFEKQISAFKARVESLMKENYTLTEQLQNEQKQSAKLRNDGKKALNQIANLNQQLEQMNGERMNQQNTVQKNDKAVADLRKQINDLEQKMMIYKKQKQELLAELEAERNICQIKKDGLKMATEDICNANSIIRKQAAEIDILRKKVELRTEVALKQEQLLRDANKGKENMGNVIGKIDEALKKNTELSKDTENRIQAIRDKTNLIESKYRDRIDDLYDKLCTVSQPKQSQNNINNAFGYGY